MQNLMLFKNEVFGEIRIVGEGNDVLFVGKDIAICLGYKDCDQALRTHVDSEDKLTRKINGSGQIRNMTCINESGMYSLILGSKLDSAKQFKRWVTSEVLPQIRQTGGYIPINEQDDDETILAKALLVAHKTIEKKQIIIQQQSKQIEEQRPFVELAKKRLDKNGLISITDTTSTFELKRGKLTRWAKDNGYLHKCICEVNEKGKQYFRVYDSKGYKCIGVTENGLKFINDNMEEIK